MSTLTTLCAFAVVLAAGLGLQGVLLRAAFRREIAKQNARHTQVQQTMVRHLEQAKRQIGHLQSEIAEARLRLKRSVRSDAGSTQRPSPARHALEREIDNASATRKFLPVDGFADTQPSPSVTQHGSLSLLLQ